MYGIAKAWFRQPLAGYAREVRLSWGAQEREVFTPGAIGALLDEHAGGRRHQSARVWVLLCFEEWARQWCDQ